jgi:hypothetical protein
VGLVAIDRQHAPAAAGTEQLRDFPHGQHDDGPDALEMAIRLATGLLAPPDPVGYELIPSDTW